MRNSKQCSFLLPRCSSLWETSAPPEGVAANYYLLIDVCGWIFPSWAVWRCVTHLKARIVVSPSAVSEKWQSRGSWVLSSSSWRSLGQRQWHVSPVSRSWGHHWTCSSILHLLSVCSKLPCLKASSKRFPCEYDLFAHYVPHSQCVSAVT